MKNSRSVLLSIAVIYAIYSIGRGMWGIAQTQSTGGKVLLACAFIALLGVCGFIVYMLFQQQKKINAQAAKEREQAEAEAQTDTDETAEN